MIKFERTEVFNFDGALHGMRNPLNSWDRSDSFHEYVPCGSCNGKSSCISGYHIGKNDLDLAQRLIKGGSVHAKFMRQIFVSVDITAPLYWWKEFDTYKVGTVANSCSTMHKIHSKEFELSDFSTDKLLEISKREMNCIINILNDYRQKYIDTKDKIYWWQMIQLLPSSYNQKRTVTMSYENIRAMYIWRRNHKLDEWSIGFMEWIDSLPYADELIKI